VFWNAEYLVDEMKRDSLVKSLITKLPGIYVEECQDQCVVSPREIKNKVRVNLRYEVFVCWSHFIDSI
jgi:deoxyribodipyrimidine photo-lyase